MDQLSTYERNALAEVMRRRDRKLARRGRVRVPQVARRGASAVGQRAAGAPGVERMGDAVLGAAGGAGKAVNRTVRGTLSAERVLATYRKRGVDVADLADLRGVDLEQLDRAAKRARLRHRYALAASTEGGLAGMALTGGLGAAIGGGVFGLGAAAAPGLGTIAGAIAGDAAIVLGRSGT